ncbi:ankyrin repeat domain-containing protein [Mucilaginibacter polytrichastri]|uniref:Uncharacterized protein n=1 Tax=Mucilaginibacter polytrichastri TaxID=1302689 RepID=A0A1Q6A0D9_9SPHI|nr:ankyrin repeat domain-containing protein [Mucilaginibacter polytrichastri]OKS87442.1 hypothetical protein RG47T_2903 [Mucilaginibacter polytrichastri]SFS90698.1 Ankyrin repeat [Mucilaginibacter polytrichastri]
MPDQSTLYEALRNDNIQEAREILNDESNFPSDLTPFDRIQLFEKLIQHKAFDIIIKFVDHKLVETDLYEYDTFNNTLLHKVLFNLKDDDESIAFFNELLAKLENINDAVDNQTLLGYAFEIGAAPNLIKSLINAGCDINWINNAEDTFLHKIAANNRIQPEKAAAYLKLMLQEGLAVDAVDIVHKTPLLIAISNNKPLLIDLLLENGASCNIPDDKGETAFYYAVVHQQSLALYLKLRASESPDFEVANKNGETILFEFLNRLSRPSDTILEFLTTLIEDGADLYLPATFYGREKTPADVIAEKPFAIFNTVFQLGKLDVGRVDKNGNSILHKVCAFNVNYDSEMAKDTYRKVKLLIENGADVNLTNNNDETPLMLASTDNLKSKTVELLLTHK